MNTEFELAWSLALVAIGMWVGIKWSPVLLSGLNLFRIESKDSKRPPTVHLSDYEIFDAPMESYERALSQNGPVISVRRKGRTEYIVSERFTQQVLTDDTNFSFENGVAKTLNIQFLYKLFGGTFFRQMDTIITELVSQRLDIIVRQIYPIFQQSALELRKSNPSAPIDLLDYTQKVVADAMLHIILGKGHISDENRAAVVLTANGVAELTGLFQNQSYFARTFPFLWRMVTWVKVMIIQIGFKVGGTLGPAVWSEISRVSKDSTEFSDKEDATLLSILVRRCVDKSGNVSLGSRLWILALLIAAIFASVHQTVAVMIWVVFEAALRPDSQQAIREELSEITDYNAAFAMPPDMDLSTLRDAGVTDSFIREVMRMKGDTLSTVRMTTRSVELGEYIIPAGSPVIPLASLAHRSAALNGERPHEFMATRWVGADKPAVMPGPGYLSFGLGRWACPGRFLAIAEIKMLLFSLLSVNDLEMEGGRYVVVDKLNVTSAPPEGKLVLKSL